MSRIHFVDKLAYPKFISLMQISRLHIYLTYPFVLSWSMLEAMGCGATVLASSTAPVKEFIRDGENGFLFDFFSQQELVERAVDIMQRDNSAIGDAARQMIATNFSFSRSIQPKYQSLINSVMSNGVSSESI
jgi:glycosyltransferase involved in cell wall biosynthesis